MTEKSALAEHANETAITLTSKSSPCCLISAIFMKLSKSTTRFSIKIVAGVMCLYFIHRVINSSPHPELFFSTTDFIHKYGFIAEVHQVVSEDGYFTNVHRILPKINSGEVRPVVLMMHGFASSTELHLMRGPQHDLPYILVNQGFDVWMADIRGNCHSLGHVNLTTNQSEFWDFGYHEMSVYDLPATIDHILNYTGQPHLVYVGYSVGSSMFFVLSSIRPEYNHKVKIMVSLAALTEILESPTFPQRVFFFSVDLMGKAAKLLKKYQVFPKTYVRTRLVDVFCQKGLLFNICEYITFVVAGESHQHKNETLFPFISSHLPAGFSYKQFLHITQNMQQGGFRFFDYGTEGNLQRYNSTLPPAYDLTKVNVPVALYYSSNDALVPIQNSEKLASLLPHVIRQKLIASPFFNHGDFIWAKDARELVYEDVLEVLQEWQGTKTGVKKKYERELKTDFNKSLTAVKNNFDFWKYSSHMNSCESV